MEMAGEDASLDAAVARITGKITPEDVGGEPAPRRDARENREDRDPTEQDDYHDLSDLEAMERAEKAEKGQEAKTQGDAEGKDGQEAAADDDAFLELPAAEEGAEPERVPLKEAVEAVQKLRQMNGDIAQAITRAEMEAQQRNDAAYDEIVQMHETVRERAEMALQAIPAPKPPPRYLRDPNSPNYDPQLYADLMLQYEDQARVYKAIEATAVGARQAKEQAEAQATEASNARENERLVRHLPDWGDETKRLAIAQSLTDGLEKHFGIKADDPVMAKVPFDHRFVLAMKAAIEAREAPKKAVEVRKHVQEKAAKIVNGRLPEREKATGRFVSEARKELRETGSEDAFARMLIRSGALKGL